MKMELDIIQLIMGLLLLSMGIYIFTKDTFREERNRIHEGEDKHDDWYKK